MFCTYCSSHDKISYNFSLCILILMQSPNTQLQNAMCFPLIFIKRHFASVVMLCGFTVNYLMSFLFLKTHLNLIETTYWVVSFFLTSALCRAVSREAARKRRRVESDVFGDLSRLLPLQPSVRAHLDKPSVIRLTLSYIRTHTLFKGTNRHHAHIACTQANVLTPSPVKRRVSKSYKTGHDYIFVQMKFIDIYIYISVYVCSNYINQRH